MGSLPGTKRPAHRRAERGVELGIYWMPAEATNSTLGVTPPVIVYLTRNQSSVVPAASSRVCSPGCVTAAAVRTVAGDANPLVLSDSTVMVSVGPPDIERTWRHTYRAWPG